MDRLLVLDKGLACFDYFSSVLVQPSLSILEAAYSQDHISILIYKLPKLVIILGARIMHYLFFDILLPNLG